MKKTVLLGKKMSHFYESVRDERQMKALTGLGREKFEFLLKSFSESLKELESKNYQVNRQQRTAWWRTKG